MSTNVSDVIFFLGAGASVKADVPDTYAFVKKFRDSIQEHSQRKTIDEVINILEEWKKSKIDIELLLETLMKLDTKEQEPLPQFYKGARFRLVGSSAKTPIINSLKDFIKSKAIVNEEKVKYLEPLLEFQHPIDIISVNYDICIEQFCNIYKLTYQDGFDVYWNPKVFELEDTDVRLYKLHGSVIWYRSDRGGYLKLPVMEKSSKIQLITGESAESLMLYPIQKWEYAEPLLELLLLVKRKLESSNTKFIVVVGYSFRDDYLKKMFWDIARKNRALNLILVDPNAYQIYLEKLKYYDSRKKKRSSLDGRVICLPYEFEKIFPCLKNEYLKNLREGLACDFSAQKDEMEGKKANWVSCLKPFVNSEYTEKLESILKDKINRIDLDTTWELNIELYLRMFLNFLAGNQETKLQEYLNKFIGYLKIVFVEKIHIELISEREIPFIRIGFNYIKINGGSNDARVYDLTKLMEKLLLVIDSKVKMFIRKSDKKSESLKQMIMELESYLKKFSGGEIKLEEYLTMREHNIENIQEFRDNYKEYASYCSAEDRCIKGNANETMEVLVASKKMMIIPQLRKRLETTIENTEHAILQNIIQQK